MSTRSNLIIKDDRNSIQLYRHSDGYPESEHGVIATLEQALEFCWPLPRMEADDFAAAIVRAWKKNGGNIYIDGDYKGRESLHSDIEYYYVIEPDSEAGMWKVNAFKCWENDKLVYAGHIGVANPNAHSMV